VIFLKKVNVICMSEGFMLTVCEIYILTPKEKKKKKT